MTPVRRRPRAIARALTRPTPDLRWAALATAALAALYGLFGGPATSLFTGL